MTARREKSFRQAGVIVLGSAALLTPFLIYAWGHIQIITTGYSVEVLDARIHDLEHENRTLRLAKARLEALPRIEERARQLGLLPPDPARILVVTVPDRGPAPAPPPFARAAALPPQPETR